ETNDYAASDHVKALYRHLDGPFIHKIVINNEEIPENVKLRYKGEEAVPVKMDKDKLLKLDLEIISRPIATVEDNMIRHNPEKVAAVLYQLLLEEWGVTKSS